MVAVLRQAVHTWYQLSCGHTARQLVHARGNTTECLRCYLDGEWERVFILSTHYEKPLDDSD